MKMLLYCTKSRPYLMKGFAKPMHGLDYTDPTNFSWISGYHRFYSLGKINGKIVAECDFEIEEIDYLGVCPSMYQKELTSLSCLSNADICKYLNGKNGFAIRLKNIHTFEPPKQLSDYCYKKFEKTKVAFYENTVNAVCCTKGPIKVAPQNMQYAYDPKTGEKYVLISIRPQWLEKILNGEKTIEIRKKILKGLN